MPFLMTDVAAGGQAVNEMIAGPQLMQQAVQGGAADVQLKQQKAEAGALDLQRAKRLQAAFANMDFTTSPQEAGDTLKQLQQSAQRDLQMANTYDKGGDPVTAESFRKNYDVTMERIFRMQDQHQKITEQANNHVAGLLQGVDTPDQLKDVVDQFRAYKMEAPQLYESLGGDNGLKMLESIKDPKQAQNIVRAIQGAKENSKNDLANARLEEIKRHNDQLDAWHKRQEVMRDRLANWHMRVAGNVASKDLHNYISDLDKNTRAANTQLRTDQTEWDKLENDPSYRKALGEGYNEYRQKIIDDMEETRKDLKDLKAARQAALVKSKELGMNVHAAPPMSNEKNRQMFPNAPSIGTVQRGYKYKGGDPSKPDSWEVQ